MTKGETELRSRLTHFVDHYREERVKFIAGLTADYDEPVADPVRKYEKKRHA